MLKNHFKLKIVIAIIILIYTFILSICGLFGNTIQEFCISFTKNVLPYIGIAIGYFFAIFLPIRIVTALERNKQLKEDYEKEARLDKHISDNKELQQKILNLLNKEDTL